MKTRSVTLAASCVIAIGLSVAACSEASPGGGSSGGADAEKSIKMGYSSVYDFDDMPSLLALERLEEEGYTVEKIQFAESELNIEALAQGVVNFAEPAGTVLAAAEKAGNVVIIAEQAANGWSVISDNSIASCADLDGRDLAIHSEGSFSGAMVRQWIETDCPGTEPNWLLIPGSENRAAAITAQQIEATPVELADKIQLTRSEPDRLHVLTDFAITLPEIMGALYVVNSDWAADNRQTVLDFLTAVVEVHREIASNPDILRPIAKEYLALDDADLDAVLSSYVETGAFDVDGGMTEASLSATIDFLIATDWVSADYTAEQAGDLSYLSEVLELLE